jgi:hypothetical protein
MNCSEIRSRLDDWAAGRLDEGEAQLVAGHLAACGSCRDEARSSLALARAVASLPRSILPPRDVWPEVSARLDGVARPTSVVEGRPGARRWSLAAAAVALVVVTAATTFLLVRGEGPGHEIADRSAPSAATTEELLRALEARGLPPETMAVVQRNLAVIDVAIAELEAALERDPDNEELARMLVSTYQKKADLIERAARVKEEG